MVISRVNIAIGIAVAVRVCIIRIRTQDLGINLRFRKEIKSVLMRSENIACSFMVDWPSPSTSSVVESVPLGSMPLNHSKPSSSRSPSVSMFVGSHLEIMWNY